VTGESITNGQRAVAALEAITAYAQARDQPGNDTPRDEIHHEPGPDLDGLSRVLCALRHHADRVSGHRFDDMLNAARQNYQRHRAADARPVSPAQVTAVRRALEVHDQATGSPKQYRNSFWPPDTLAEVRQYASTRGLSVEAATGRLAGALITDLQHYADDHGVDFDRALAASSRAYTEQRLREEGPFPAGCDTRQSAVLVSSPATSPFQPIATRQGVVTSIYDAEWLLVRTAARLHDAKHRGFAESDTPDDVNDKLALSDALAAMCGLTGSEILGRLAPQIMARADEMERAVAAAAEMGRTHGIAGARSYCPFGLDGDYSPLMEAFGETEWKTDANAGYRFALVDAYATAYARAGRHSGAAAVQIVGRDFPQTSGGSFSQGNAASAASPSEITARAESRRPRKGLQ
jgi:hypothetical protein